jgi:hypothetical protein
MWMMAVNFADLNSLHSATLAFDAATVFCRTVNSDQYSALVSLILTTQKVSTTKPMPWTNQVCMEVTMNFDWTDPRLIALATAVVVIVAVAVWLYMRKRRGTTAALRQKFGREYDRAVLAHGSERKAEAKLADREKRVEMLNIRDLDSMERERYSTQWQSIQSRFVDSPKGAVAEADDLVSSVMKARGYPVSEFDQRAADISVDHPRVVENYRSGHAIALRVGKDQATTEELRTAMIHYRSLFEELVQVTVAVERKEVA